MKWGSTIGVIKRDTRSRDYGLYRGFLNKGSIFESLQNKVPLFMETTDIFNSCVYNPVMITLGGALGANDWIPGTEPYTLLHKFITAVLRIGL